MYKLNNYKLGVLIFVVSFNEHVWKLMYTERGNKVGDGGGSYDVSISRKEHVVEGR